MATPLLIPSISTEYVNVPFTSADTAAITAVQLAFVAPGVTPAGGDWYPAQWDGAVAKVLIGPDGGALTLPADTIRTVWLRAEAGTEHPARPCGYVMAYDRVT